MNYALEVLENEKRLLSEALTDWDIKQYPGARIIRESRLRQIDKAILLISESGEFESSVECKTE